MAKQILKYRLCYCLIDFQWLAETIEVIYTNLISQMQYPKLVHAVDVLQQVQTIDNFEKFIILGKFSHN